MVFDELDDLYHDIILDHCRHPRNPEKLEDADIIADGVNPFCGDEIHLQIRLDQHGRVARIGSQGQGCSINQGAGSMLSEAIEGKTLDEIEEVSALFNEMLLGDVPSDTELKHLHDLEALSGVRRFPVRIKCALLSWSTLEEGIERYRRDHSP